MVWPAVLVPPALSSIVLQLKVLFSLILFYTLFLVGVVRYKIHHGTAAVLSRLFAFCFLLFYIFCFVLFCFGLVLVFQNKM